MISRIGLPDFLKSVVPLILDELKENDTQIKPNPPTQTSELFNFKKSQSNTQLDTDSLEVLVPSLCSSALLHISFVFFFLFLFLFFF